MANTTWQEKAKQKRSDIRSAIPDNWLITDTLPSPFEKRDFTGDYIEQYLTQREIEITNTEAVSIVAKTSTGQWKAVEVAAAFCHRAALAHQMVNCLHEFFPKLAIVDAKKCDDYYEKHGKPIGPLHGLPISLKDQFHVKGVETTMGYVGWIGTFEGRKNTGMERVFESEMVRELRRMGAVMFCKTAVPHTLMLGETQNHIIEYTWNPKNRLLSCGGSSGGEGALMALKGSPVGFGTDIGGSIRIPAAFNGLYGIRPSAGRMPYEGVANSMDGQNSLLSVIGPMGTSVGALQLTIKSVLSQEPWLHDPLCFELPWRSEQEQAILDVINNSNDHLTFGVMRQDGSIRPHPPVSRAIELVVKTVERLGHKVIEWDPPTHDRAMALLSQVWMFDGGRDIHDALALSGETIAPQLLKMYGSTHTHPEKTASQIARLNIQKRQYQKEYMEYWNSTSKQTATGRSVDAIICPIAPYAAANPEVTHLSSGYSCWVNLLDYAASTFPVLEADKTIDVFDKKYKPQCGMDRETWMAYDAELYDGAFVGVQLVGRRFQEEKVLKLTEIISQGLKAEGVM